MEYDIAAAIEIGLGFLFYVLLLVFSIHAIFVSYHWFTYGTSKRVSLLAFSIYLGGGALLLLTYAIAEQAL